MKNKIQKWFHDKLKQGYKGTLIGGDSFQQTYSCKFCNYKITQDSNGDWFHLSSKLGEN